MELSVGDVVPFASTFLGVFVAFLLGVWWQGRQEAKGEEKRRRATKASIASELNGILGSVRKTFSLWEQAQLGEIPHVDLSTDAKESAVASGRFTLLELEFQVKVSHIYAVVERAKVYREKMIETLPGTINQTLFPGLSSSFKGQLQHLTEVIPSLVQELSSD